MNENENETKQVENEELNQESNDFKQKVSSSTDELKNETVDAVKQVKENMKNVNVKEEAKAAKGFIGEMIKNPIEKIKEIANDTSNKYFKTSIILVIVWMVAALFGTISFKYFTWSAFGNTLLNYIKTILAPLLSVLAMGMVIFVTNKKSKKSLITVLTTVVTTKLPVIIAKVISLLTIISSNISPITSKVTSLASIISTVFMYFAIKDLFDIEDEKEGFNKFIIVETIYIVVAFVIYYLGIYI